MSSSRRPRPGRAARTAGQSLYQKVRDVLITGVIVLLPVVITVYVLSIAARFLQRLIDPVIRMMSDIGVTRGIRDFIAFEVLARIGIYESPFIFLSEVLAVLILVLLVVAAGLLAKSGYGKRLIDMFDYVISMVPAVGPVYQTFRRMSDVMLESGVENFREVKLVEFPRNDIYVLGFVTNDSPVAVSAATGTEGMQTMFLPLAPNPVMGGFLTYVSSDRVIDVDMEVQEAVQLIVTSGIATEDPEDGEYRQLAAEERGEFGMPDAGDVSDSDG